VVHQRGRRRGQSVSTQTSLISHGGNNNQASSSMMTPSDHSGGLAAKNGLSSSKYYNRNNESRLSQHHTINDSSSTSATTTRSYFLNRVAERRCCQTDNVPSFRSQVIDDSNTVKRPSKSMVAETSTTNTRPSRSLQLLKSKTAASRARSRSVIASSPLPPQEEEEVDVSSIESNDDNEDTNNCVLRVLLENAAAKTGRKGMDVSKYIRILEDEWIIDVTSLRQVDGKTLDELLPILLSRELQRLIHQNEYNKFALTHMPESSTTHVQPLLEGNEKISTTRPSNSLHSLKSKIAMRKMSQVSNQENVQRLSNKSMDDVPASIAFISPKSVDVESSATNSSKSHHSVKDKTVAASKVIQAPSVDKLYDEMFALEAKFLVKGSKKEHMVAQVKSSSASVLDRQEDTKLLPPKRSSALPNLLTSIPPKTRPSRTLQSLKNKTAASRVRSNSPSICKMSPVSNHGHAEHTKSNTSSTLPQSTASTPPKLPTKVMMNVRPEYMTNSQSTSKTLQSLKSKTEASRVRTSSPSVHNASFMSDTDSKKPLQTNTLNTSIASSLKKHIELPAVTTTNLQCAAKKYRRQKRMESKCSTMSAPKLDQKKIDTTNSSSSLQIMDDDISVTASLFSASSIAAALPNYDIESTKRSLRREKKVMHSNHTLPLEVNETKVLPSPPQPVTKTIDDQSSIASTITDTTSLFYGISHSMSGTSAQSISSRRRQMIRLRKMRSVLGEY